MEDHGLRDQNVPLEMYRKLGRHDKDENFEKEGRSRTCMLRSPSTLSLRRCNPLLIGLYEHHSH